MVCGITTWPFTESLVVTSDMIIYQQTCQEVVTYKNCFHCIQLLPVGSLATRIHFWYHIAVTLELSDLDAIKDSALRKFDERVAKAAPGNREEIEREAARLESQLEQLYSLTALMAKREPDMAKTAELWRRLVRICDVFASRIGQFSQQRELATSAYDSILDIRGGAEELRALHSP